MRKTKKGLALPLVMIMTLSAMLQCVSAANEYSVTINTINAGDTTVTGTADGTLVDDDGNTVAVVVCFPNDQQGSATVNSDNTWSVDVPAHVTLAMGDEVTAIQEYTYIPRIDKDLYVENITTGEDYAETGDILLYDLIISNTGYMQLTANSVAVTIYFKDAIMLQENSIRINHRTVPSSLYVYDSAANVLTLYLGDINGGGSVLVSFRTRVDADLTDINGSIEEIIAYTDTEYAVGSRTTTIVQAGLLYHPLDYNPNGGKGAMTDPSSPYAAGSTAYILKNEFERTGYTFNGWNTKADGTGISYTPDSTLTVTEDITLYAQWRENDGGGITSDGEHSSTPESEDNGYTGPVVTPPTGVPSHNNDNTFILGGNGNLIEIDPEGVPLGEWSQDENEVWIYEEFTPPSVSPQTGGGGPVCPLLLIGLTALAGAIWIGKRNPNS